MRVRSLSLVTIAMLLAGLFPAGVGGVRAASPVLIDPDPQNYTIAVQGGGLAPEHRVCGLNLDPQHTAYCGGGYPYPSQYGVKYGYPVQYGTKYSTYPAKYGVQYTTYPAKYGVQYAAYPSQYGYPTQYASYPSQYNTPATLPDSTIACVTSPSGAAVVVGALMTCTATNTFFSDTTNDGTVSISGGATLSGSASVSGNTISFSVALNSAATATIVVTYVADTSGSNEKHAAATHYLDTINGSATGIAAGVFTISGDSVSISGLDPMSVWLAGDTLGQDTVTVTSGSKDTVAVTLTGCSTASGSDVLSASVASGATLLVYGRAAGTCQVTGAVNGASTTVSTTVSTRAQTITFATIADRLMTDALTFSIAPTASSGLTVTTTSSTTGVCTISGTTVTIVAYGTCTLTAAQTGNATYAAAPNVTRSFAIARATQPLNGATLTISPTGTIAAGSSFTASYAGTTYGLLTWQTSGPCNSLSTSPTATINVTAGGSCAVSLYASGSAIYAPATSATASVATANASQTISFTAPESPSSAVTATLSATATSGFTVAFSASPSSVCSVSGSTVTYLATGSCTISADQAGGSNGSITYGAAATVSRTVTVSAEPQVISFTNLPTGLSVADGSFTISTSVSSGLAATVVSDTEAVCTISGSTVTIVAAGTCTLTASRAGATVAQVRYDAAPDVTKSTTIIKADQVAPTITVAAGPYTAGTTKSATVAGGTAAGTRSWTLSGACSGSNTAIVLNTAGDCVISVSYAGTADYNSVTASTTITVIAANQTISFTEPASPVNVGTSAALSATASSGLTVTFSTSTASICSISGATVSYDAAGTCSITAAQAGNTTYGAATNVTRSVTVNASAQTISASGDATWTGDDGVLGSTATLTATASSGLAVSAESTTTSVCTISSGGSPWTVTFVGLGDCSVSFTRAGGVNAGTTYLAATPLTLTSTVATIPAPTVGSPNAVFSVDPDDVARASSVVQMTDPATATDGSYGSGGSFTIALSCGSQGGDSLIDAIEFTRILSIDGAAQGSAIGRADCTDESYTVSGLSNGSYAISARAVAGSTKSAVVSVGSIVVGAAPTVSINAISGATDGGSLSYLKTLTPTLSWSLESGDVMTGQTLVRYSATPTAEGVCPAGAALGSATAAAGWTPDITFASGTTPATLATGDRSKSFANTALPERCVQFGHTGVNGAFSATIWSEIYLVDVTKPSLAPTISGMISGVVQACATVSVQACRIEPGNATVSVTASDPSASGVSGSGVLSVQLRGAGFDTRPRPYTGSTVSRSFVASSDRSSLTLYATVRDRAGNSISIPISFSVAAATEPVFNAVVDLVDCTDTSVVIRPDFAEQGFLYWPVGAELCLVPRVDMAVKGYRYINGVAQESVFIGTLTSKLTGAASSVTDNARGKIGKWPTTKIDETFTHGQKPLSLRQASDQYGRGVFLYEKIAAGTATDAEKALYRSSVLRFRIDAETSIDNADAAPYISIPLSFTYAYGWVTLNTTGPLRAYVTPKAVSITLRVIAVNLGAGQ